MTLYQRQFRIAQTFVVVCTIILSCGCDHQPQNLEPDKLVAVTPETQLGMQNQYLTNAVCVELLSKSIPGVLGGKGRAHPMAGIKLTMQPSDPASGLQAYPPEGVTDAGGELKFSVRLGSQFGDQYLDVFCQEYPSIRVRLRFVAGITIENNRQEVIAGEMLSKPLKVRLTDHKHEPLADIPVFFTLAGQPGKTGYLVGNKVLTDHNGIAEVNLQTDRRATGAYNIKVEVADTARHLYTRSFLGEALAISPASILIVVLGGLAIFIFGVTLMSDGLQQVAGNKMKTALVYITRNRVTGILAGATLTALIQSSSLMTVMTVGFVNAGLLTLRQAIGVVFGANIGTTVMGQMISFNITGMSLPAMIIGVILLMVSRKGVLQGAARSILGFGLLFYGMTLMSNELRSVAIFPSFANFFQTFDCTPPVPGANMPISTVMGALGIGVFVTCIIQSSAATIGLTIALANSGLISFWTAVPIVLGDNIGTTITALMASINANRTARQTAMAHSMFNVLGSAIMIGLFYIHIKGVPCFLFLINHITAGNVFLGENVGRHVAMTHSLFNIINVVVMAPFIGVLAWLCELILPGKKVTSSTVRLEMNLLNTPPLALFCAMRALGDMTETAWRAASAALRGYKDGDPAPLEDIQKTEDEVDEWQQAIMDYLVQLTRKDLTEKQAAAIPILMHCVNDAERISDLALFVARRSASQTSVATCLSETARLELDTLVDKATTIAGLTRDSLQDGRLLAKAVETVIVDMKKLAQDSMQNHVNRIQNGLCTPERGLVYVEVVSAIENIVRHLDNIAQRSDIMTMAASRHSIPDLPLQ